MTNEQLKVLLEIIEQQKAEAERLIRYHAGYECYGLKRKLDALVAAEKALTPPDDDHRPLIVMVPRPPKDKRCVEKCPLGSKRGGYVGWECSCEEKNDAR